MPGQLSVALVCLLSRPVVPTSVRGGETDGSPNSLEPQLPRVLTSVLHVPADSIDVLLWFSEVPCFKHTKPFEKVFAHVLGGRRDGRGEPLARAGPPATPAPRSSRASRPGRPGDAGCDGSGPRPNGSASVTTAGATWSSQFYILVFTGIAPF